MARNDIVRTDPFFFPTLFDRDPFVGGLFMPRFEQAPAFAPMKIDVKETDTEYTVHTDMPGVAKEDINIDADTDTKTLTISYEKKEETGDKDENGKWIHRERTFSSARRSISFADGNFEAVSAGLADGVLTVTVPKKEHETTQHKIEIQ